MMSELAEPVTRLAAALAALAIAAGALPAKADPTPVQLNGEATLGGIGVACTGIGQSKDLPKWLAYPVKLVFADPKGLLLADVIVAVADAKGAPLLEMHCAGPWVLLKLPPRTAYKVEARLTQPGPAPRTATIKAPTQGQATFVITFPDAQG